MKIAVVTPYYREADDVLRTCLDSVRAQTHTPCRHFLVSDGFPNPLVEGYDLTHIRLPNAHGDNGNLGRCVGAFTAMSEGYDGIAFLDADNWFRPDHIARLAALHARTGAAICTTGRSIHALDGSLLMAVDRESDGVGFADTSCLCVFRPAFDLIPLWGLMPREAGPICDRLMWEAVIMRGISRAHDPEPSMAFRSQYRNHYTYVGKTPPAEAKTDEVDAAGQEFRARPYASRIGLLLGLAGAEELDSLAAAQSIPDAPKQPVRLEAFGRFLTLDLPDDDGTRRARDEIFAEQAYRPVPALPPPRAILDIGANVGLNAAYFRLAFPMTPIVCVEPDPHAFRMLARNAEAIGNCHPIRTGVHLGSQVRSFRLAEGIMARNAAPPGENNAARLLMIDAESLTRNLMRDDFDLIKVDAGGSELPILLSLRARLSGTAIVQVVFHSDADRRLIDALLSESHLLWHAAVRGPHRGTLCYVARAAARDIQPPRP